ncbi:fatty acyl-AMP ligase [Rathayibacter iranicus]|uniref:fatty acyl-AMP ligase n=1 Tax=Rathayibacter iranicus TaxID=59737 RepID=UPI00132617E3|nr:fatty acyl-AMP ligase [Rathayibacter iranicus]MWV31693.1 AMP-binding protein [Rathayibacter iranicus NCPPB 2253 = VKM Ac-1602]
MEATNVLDPGQSGVTRLVGGRTHVLTALEQHVRERPEATAYEYYTSFDMESRYSVLSFHQLDEVARVIGSRLAERTRPGDRVALMFPTGPEFVQALLGTFYAGAIAVPVPYPSAFNAHGDRLEGILQDCTPELVVTTDDMAGDPAVEEARSSDVRQTARLSLSSLTQGPPGEQRTQYDLECGAFIQYTSGSTGRPKGVVVSHGNLSANLELIQLALQGSPTTPVVGWIPHTHDMGLVGHLLWSLYAAAPCSVVPPLEFAKRPTAWIDMISDGGYYGTAAPNSAYEVVARIYPDAKLSDLDLSRWSVALNGAEPISAKSTRRFTTRFATAGFQESSFVPAYGLAEATLFVTCSRPQEPVSIRRFDTEQLWKGRAIETSEPHGIELVASGPANASGITVRDHTGVVVGDHQLGTIHVRGDHVTRRYWNQPPIGADLDTGDFGFIYEGDLYVTGRAKDLIIVNGRNIAATDVEESVSEICTLARPDGVVAFQSSQPDDARVHIFIEVPRSLTDEISGKSTIDEVIQDQLSSQFGITALQVTKLRAGQIPRTTSGKVRRAETYNRFGTPKV